MTDFFLLCMIAIEQKYNAHRPDNGDMFYRIRETIVNVANTAV